MKSQDVIAMIQKQADPVRAKVSQGFFKTGVGGYGESDIFLGLTVPAQRVIAKACYAELSFTEVRKLLASPVHEHRFVALEVLVFKFEKGTEDDKRRVYDFYLTHTKRVNNWDLVDTSAPYIVGAWMLEHNSERKKLYELAKSKNLWERRIAIVATWTLIAESQFDDTLRIAELLLSDSHDLIHKAVGWMLREVGKKSERTLEAFLKKHCKIMPRTMLRYAIERLSEAKRKKYMAR